jgi:uncharacterized membrane protein
MLPDGGYIILIDAVTITIEDAFKMIISGGIVSPGTLNPAKPSIA